MRSWATRGPECGHTTHWRLGTLVGHARAGGGRHRRRAAAIGFEPDISRSLARRKADCGVIACVSDPCRNWRRAALGAIKESPLHRRECAQLAATVARQRVAHHPAEAVSGTEDARLVDAVILGYRLQERSKNFMSTPLADRSQRAIQAIRIDDDRPVTGDRLQLIVLPRLRTGGPAGVPREDERNGLFRIVAVRHEEHIRARLSVHLNRQIPRTLGCRRIPATGGWLASAPEPPAPALPPMPDPPLPPPPPTAVLPPPLPLVPPLAAGPPMPATAVPPSPAVNGPPLALEPPLPPWDAGCPPADTLPPLAACPAGAWSVPEHPVATATRADI